MEYKKIAIDIGHNCFPDTGALGIRKEDELTAEVGNLLIGLLEKQGVKCVSVLPQNAVSVSSSLQQRVSNANRAKCDFYVSIHFNAFNSKAHGSEVYAISAPGKKVAQQVLDEIVALGYRNRGIKEGGKFYVIRQTSMPAILVECAFCDNALDMERFDAGQMAAAIAAGITGQSVSLSHRQQYLKIKLPTWLKQSTEQATDIADPHAKFKVEAGTRLSIKSWTEVAGHLRVELVDPINGQRIWNAFSAHVELIDPVFPAMLPDDGPQVDREQPPESQLQPVQKEENGFKLPGYESIFYLQNPIIPGGHFSWAEALNGGSRIPKTKAEVDNIIALATRLEEVRERLGGMPITVTSWYRPEPWNSQAGGAPKSRHKTGEAVDILRSGMTGGQMAAKLQDWSGGMGIYRHYPNMIHLDIRPFRARWGGA